MRGWVLMALAIWSIAEFFVYWWLTFSHDRDAQRERSRFTAANWRN